MYCNHCGAENEIFEWDETDCPENCGECGCPLPVSLTAEGESYALEAASEELSSIIAGRDHIIPLMGTAEESCLSYYHGSRHSEIVADWLRGADWSELAQCYLARIERAQQRHPVA